MKSPVYQLLTEDLMYPASDPPDQSLTEAEYL